MARRRYSKQEIRRNRIIALVILLAFLVLIFSAFSCVARALTGQDEATQSSLVERTSSAIISVVPKNPSPATGSVATGSSNALGALAAHIKERAGAAGVGASVLGPDEGVEDPWVEGGRFTTGDAELDTLVKEYCDVYADSSRSAYDNAYEAYKGVAWADYVESDDNQRPVGPDWDIQYAKQWFYKQNGNCYEFAAANEYMFKYFGFSDAQAMPVNVLLQSGNYGEHGLTFVTSPEGNKCLCDTSLGINGWMLDADSYTLQAIDVGQDPEEFTVANFEDVVKAKWLA